MRNFRWKLGAAAAFVKLGARRRTLPPNVSGVAEYLPELKAILIANQERQAAGETLRFPRVQVAGCQVTLMTLPALEVFESSIKDWQQATSVKVELAERRRAVKREGHDSLLRAALIQRYGLRVVRGAS